MGKTSDIDRTTGIASDLTLSATGVSTLEVQFVVDHRRFRIGYRDKHDAVHDILRAVLESIWRQADVTVEWFHTSGLPEPITVRLLKP